MSKEEILEKIRKCFYDFAKEFPLDEAYIKIDYDDIRDTEYFYDLETEKNIYPKYFYNGKEVKPYYLASPNKKTYELWDNISLVLNHEEIDGYCAYLNKKPKSYELCIHTNRIFYSIKKNDKSLDFFDRRIVSGNIFYNLGGEVTYEKYFIKRKGCRDFYDFGKEELRNLSLDEKSIKCEMSSIKYSIEKLFENNEENNERKAIRRR